MVDKEAKPMLDEEIEALLVAMRILPLSTDRYHMAAHALVDRQLTSQQAGVLLEGLQLGILQVRFAQKVLQARLLDYDAQFLSPAPLGTPLSNAILVAVGMAAHRPEPLKTQLVPPVSPTRREACTPRGETSQLDVYTGYPRDSPRHFCEQQESEDVQRPTRPEARTPRGEPFALDSFLEGDVPGNLATDDGTSCGVVQSDKVTKVSSSSLDAFLAQHPDVAAKIGEKEYDSAPEIERIETGILDMALRGTT